MKSIYSILVLIGVLISSFSFGQDCEIYSDYKEGSSYKMVHYDQKDKPTGFTITTVKEKNNTANGLEVLFNQKYDNNDDYTFESEFKISCEDGVVKVDMSKFLDPTTMTAYKDMDFDITADDLSIPGNASPGEQLNDGSLKVTVNTGTPVKVSVTVTLSNRKVESIETIETPAGSFECMKITYDMLSQIGFIKIKSSAVEYYNKKNGVIRSESYNKKGKLEGYSVIEEITN